MFEKLLLKTGLRFIQVRILTKHPELLYDCPVSKHNIDKIYSLMDKSKHHYDLTDDERRMFSTMNAVLTKSNANHLSPAIQSTIHTINSLNHCDIEEYTLMTKSQLCKSNNPAWAIDLSIRDIELFFDTLYMAKDVLEMSNMDMSQQESHIDQLYDILNEPEDLDIHIMSYREDIDDIESQLATYQLHYKLMKDYHIFD